MDNVCHTLCGLALARAGADRLGPLATPTLIVAANLPDLDVVTFLGGGKVDYLCHHRGITHSLLGLILLSLVLAWIVRELASVTQRSCAPFRRIWLAASIGLGSHLLLDGLNTYGIRPWLPFASHWYYGDVAFIVDPWLWLGFGSIACCGSRRNPFATIAWTIAALLGIFFLVSHPRSNGIIAGTWCVGACGALAFRVAVRSPSRRLATSWIVFAVLLIYLACLGACGLKARRKAIDLQERRGGVVSTATTHATPGIPWQFVVVLETKTELHKVAVDLYRDEKTWLGSIPTNQNHPALTAEFQQLPEFKTWKSFARNPFVAKLGHGLLLGDGRYSFRYREDWCSFLIPSK